MKKNAVMCIVVVAGFVMFASLGNAAESLRLDFSPSFMSQRLREMQAKQRTAACDRCAAAPRIDGKLDDPAWEAVEPIGPFSKSAPATTAKVCFDDKALYIGVRCDEKEGRTPVSEPRERDGRVWDDDCVEIWINPSPAEASAYQLIVNVGGAVYDSFRGNSALDLEWDSAVRRDESGWAIEVAIPFVSLGLPGPVARLGFNIGRNGPGLGPRSWYARYGDSSNSALLLEGAPEYVEVPESAFESSSVLSVIGESLGVRMDRAVLRAGERWLETGLYLQPRKEPLEGCKVVVSLLEIAGGAPLERVSVVPERGACRLLVDLRRRALERAEVAVELFEGGERTGAAKMLLSAQSCEEPARDGERIEVLLDLPPGIDGVKAWPVTFGMPFARGALWAPDRLRLVTAGGKAVPFQTEVAARWGYEGAVKWLRFDALVDVPGPIFVEIGAPGSPASPAKPLSVSEVDGLVTLDTGVARYMLARGASPISEIWMAGRRVASTEGTRGLYLVDQNDRLAKASAEDETLVVESAGPVAACVRFEGFYRTEDGEPLARHVTRVECAAGQPFANVSHTLILTRDSNEIWFKEIGWEFAVTSGSAPKALFGVDREDFSKHEAIGLSESARSAFMLQDSHYLFAHGTNHFLVGSVDAKGVATARVEGEECGDWAAVIGASGGLELGCQDTARMHPKEFEVFDDRIVVKLWSNRSGEEMDFRSPNLVDRWDVQTWHDKMESRNKRDPEYAEKVKSFKSNAQGWARTHRLLFAPLPANSLAERAARFSLLNSKPVYGLADPHWINRSRAMGANYPRDPERFPATERLIDDAMTWWITKDAEWGEHGFVDYFAGPHITHFPGHPYVRQYRYNHCTYTLRANLWLLYARSGQRRIREFAEGSNRTQMDGIHAHWGTPSNTRGLFRSSAQFGLPFYWGAGDRMEISSSSNMDDYLGLYFLCGDRRARDCVIQYGEGIKTMWTPSEAKRTSRILMATRLIAQCYAINWDPALKELAEATTDLFDDRECELWLTKERPNSSTYKTQVDIRALVDLWNILGAPRYHDMAMRVAKFWWRNSLGTSGYGYNPPMAVLGNFLYEATGDLQYAQALAVSVRHNAATYDPERDALVPKGVQGAFSTSFTFEIGRALDVLVRTDADRRCTASWVGFEDLRGSATVVVRKSSEAALNLQFLTSAERHEVGSSLRMRPVGPKSDWGLDLLRVSEVGQTPGALNTGDARVPKDAPGIDYEFTFDQLGSHYLFADSRVPMVLHAPDYWYPLPRQDPPIRYYFHLPEGNTGAQILFEGTAKLFRPDGTPHANGEALHGWVDLPDDAPGLWAFEPVDNMLVQARNFPPFFAFQTPDSFFLPEIEWARAERAETKPPLDESVVYADGVIPGKGNQAVYLAGGRGLQIHPGEKHPFGDGSLYLPHKRGTIEFWMKPQWNSTEMPEGSRSLCWGRTLVSGHYYTFRYQKEGMAKQVFMYIITDGPAGQMGNRLYVPRVFFERDRWVHVAMVWGQRDGITVYPTHKAGKNVFVMDFFIDGKGTRQVSSMCKGNDPSAPMSLLFVGDYRPENNINALIDELRISDVQRYHEDFEPPSRKQAFEIDEYTRALFHFDGDLKGLSFGTEDPVEAEFTGK